jgi:small conductance mechanosensitive channel
MEIDILMQKLIELTLSTGPSLLWALIALIGGWYIIGWAVMLLERTFEKTDFDRSLESFLTSLASVGLKVVLLVSVAGMLGFETTTLITMLGAMAFAVGMALQGSLANFAGGVLILIFKPFRAGDFISAQGYEGTVSAVQIFQTILKTVDNKQVVIPNGDLSNGSIVNYSATGTRRVDMVFGIGYDDDLKKAKTILEDIVSQEKRALKDKPVLIVLGNLGDSAVEVYCRFWVASGDYFAVKFDMNERVKEAFDAAGISFPYPQQDVHLIK